MQWVNRRFREELDGEEGVILHVPVHHDTRKSFDEEAPARVVGTRRLFGNTGTVEFQLRICMMIDEGTVCEASK